MPLLKYYFSCIYLKEFRVLTLYEKYEDTKYSEHTYTHRYYAKICITLHKKLNIKIHHKSVWVPKYMRHISDVLCKVKWQKWGTVPLSLMLLAYISAIGCTFRMCVLTAFQLCMQKRPNHS